jgi:hypothetical protein
VGRSASDKVRSTVTRGTSVGQRWDEVFFSRLRCLFKNDWEDVVEKVCARLSMCKWVLGNSVKNKFLFCVDVSHIL